ncbi:hypothetical protein C8R44DRAFT_623725 [Mycena epipterygia]|nr:hypothetical protein C8R44DRAFT_623725 [Mycena epipterygia]
MKRMVDDRRIGVLALEETHMNNIAASQFNNIYGNWFKLFNSGHPIKPDSTAGVSFLLNKKYVDTENVKEYVLVEGHAIMLVIPSHRGETLRILNICPEYTSRKREDVGPNMNSELPLPSEVLGDWNFVEDLKDRTSNKEELIPLSFLCLKALLRIQDSWRTTFPDTNEYTCFQKHTNAIKNEIHLSSSRLDRIYVPVDRFTRYRNWSIEPSLIASDHHLISVPLTCRADEQYGPGIWNLPLYLLKIQKFMKYIRARSKKLTEECEELEHTGRQKTQNIQTLWHKFKEDLTAVGKKCSRLVNERARQIRT